MDNKSLLIMQEITGTCSTCAKNAHCPEEDCVLYRIEQVVMAPGVKTVVELNEDPNFVKEVREAIKNNDGYCICALEKTSDTKCMCKEFRESTEGECHCGLYHKKLVVVKDK